MVTNHFFSSFLLHSLHLPHLFTFSITLLFFLSTKTSLPSFLSSLPDSLILLNPLIFSSSHHLLQWHPRLRTSPTSNLLMHSISPAGVELMGSLPLTYWPENHIPMAEFVSFQTFSYFQVSLRSFVLVCFWPCKCLGFVVGWV